MTETIGARIQRLASATGKPAGKPAGKHLAKALGVSFEALRQWTKGITAPSRQRAESIAAYLGVPVEVVMHGAPPPPRQPDAEALTDAFDALPVDTPQALERRRLVYIGIMGQLAAQAGR